MIDLVDEYGFVGDSTTSNDAAFADLQADIDAGLKGRLVFPMNRSRDGTVVSTGAYKTTLANPLVVKNDYTCLAFELGARIQWQPTVAGTCILFENPTGTLLKCSWENLEIRAPNDIGLQLIGVDIHDCRFSTFYKYVTAGFAGSTSTGLRVRGRDRLVFTDLSLQAERPLWWGLNDREPTSSGKDMDHCQFFNGNLVVVSPPNPCIYVDEGFVLRNSGLIGEWAFAGGPIYWNDGLTVPRRESINFYVTAGGGRFEQLADLGPVTSDTFVIDIQKNALFPLSDMQLDSVMLAPAAGNDWSGVRATNVTRTSMRHVVYRGGGTAFSGTGSLDATLCSLEGL